MNKLPNYILSPNLQAMEEPLSTGAQVFENLLTKKLLSEKLGYLKISLPALQKLVCQRLTK